MQAADIETIQPITTVSHLRPAGSFIIPSLCPFSPISKIVSDHMRLLLARAGLRRRVRRCEGCQPALVSPRFLPNPITQSLLPIITSQLRFLPSRLFGASAITLITLLALISLPAARLLACRFPRASPIAANCCTLQDSVPQSPTAKPTPAALHHVAWSSNSHSLTGAHCNHSQTTETLKQAASRTCSQEGPCPDLWRKPHPGPSATKPTGGRRPARAATETTGS